MSLTLSLNETSLIFIPPVKDSPASVVQVTISSEDKQNSNVGFLTCYFLAQHEISELVTKVLVAHGEHPLPVTCLFVGKGYALLAERKAWTLGQKWSFKWGDKHIEPATDKWTFTFQLGGEN